jgi:hypothetical protein
MVHTIGRNLGYLMILTIQTSEVTACTGDGETLSTRMKMVKRFLLNGIYRQRTRLSIDLTNKNAILIATATAYSRLAIYNPTVMGTELTLYSPIF